VVSYSGSAPTNAINAGCGVASTVFPPVVVPEVVPESGPDVEVPESGLLVPESAVEESLSEPLDGNRVDKSSVTDQPMAKIVTTTATNK
jgi:hypothetical protein